MRRRIGVGIGAVGRGQGSAAPRPRPQVVQPAAGDFAGAAAANQVASTVGPVPAASTAGARTVLTHRRSPPSPAGRGISAHGAAGAPRAARARALAPRPGRDFPPGRRASARHGAAQRRGAAPLESPDAVRAIIEAGNTIARAPYLWGGGHGKWQDKGYDCSGSVSFALASAGLLNAPLDSGRLMSWGPAGRGKWVTIYTNPHHVFLEVAGIRFDTSGQRVNGSRWQQAMRPTGGLRGPPPAPGCTAARPRRARRPRAGRPARRGAAPRGPRPTASSSPAQNSTSARPSRTRSSVSRRPASPGVQAPDDLLDARGGGLVGARRSAAHRVSLIFALGLGRRAVAEAQADTRPPAARAASADVTTSPPRSSSTSA